VDLTLFDLITSCGEPLLEQTSVRVERGSAPDMDLVKVAYVEAFRDVFPWTPAPPTQVAYHRAAEMLGLAALPAAKPPC
jgi:lipoate-protein ligase B